MEQVSRELLRAIRGTRSQVAFSRRLGYRGNPAAAWESGRRFPTAAEMLRACKRTGVDITEAFVRFHPAAAHAIGSGSDADVSNWLQEIRGGTPLGELAARVGHSRFAVSRWLSGRARPRLPEFLRVVDAITGRISDLVAELVSMDAVPALAEIHRTRSAAKRLAFEEPWTEAVLRVMETKAYRALAQHRSGFIARCLGIPLAIEERCFAAMERAGIIAREGALYREVRPLTVDTHAGTEDLQLLKAHWARVACDRARTARAGDLLSYNVLSVSKKDFARIRELLRATFREVRAIVAASEPVEVAGLMNVQLIGFSTRIKP